MMVTSSVPQGSVLAPILFLVFINNLESRVMSRVLKFADDTKILRRIRSSEDNSILQEDLNKLVEWTSKWLMFNAQKCKVMHIGKNNKQHE